MFPRDIPRGAYSHCVRDGVTRVAHRRVDVINVRQARDEKKKKKYADTSAHRSLPARLPFISAHIGAFLIRRRPLSSTSTLTRYRAVENLSIPRPDSAIPGR